MSAVMMTPVTVVFYSLRLLIESPLGKSLVYEGTGPVRTRLPLNQAKEEPATLNSSVFHFDWG